MTYRRIESNKDRETDKRICTLLKSSVLYMIDSFLSLSKTLIRNHEHDTPINKISQLNF